MRFLYAILATWLWLWFICIMVAFGFEITHNVAIISTSIVVAGVFAGKS